MEKLKEANDFLPKEAQNARLELLSRGFEFEAKLVNPGLECVALGRFSFKHHTGLLVRYACAVEASNHASFAKPMWHLLAKLVAACPEQLQATIDLLPEEAQTARRGLLDRGLAFETKFGHSGLECVVTGDFSFEQHAGLLLCYAHAVGISDHAYLAEPVSRLLAKEVTAAGRGDGLGPMLSVIEGLIECHPKEFATNYQFKAALTTFDKGPDRIRIAAMANDVRRRIETVLTAERTSIQALALVQAKLLLGSFTDKFQELFEHNPIDACSVARTLATRRHEGAGVACKVAILIAAKPAIELVAGMRNSHGGTPEAQRLSDLESAVRPLAHYFSRDVAVAVADLFVNRHGLYLEKQLATAEACSEIETQLLQELATLVNRVYKGI